jgi:hypothetical protein
VRVDRLQRRRASVVSTSAASSSSAIAVVEAEAVRPSTATVSAP